MFHKTVKWDWIRGAFACMEIDMQSFGWKYFSRALFYHCLAPLADCAAVDVQSQCAAAISQSQTSLTQLCFRPSRAHVHYFHHAKFVSRAHLFMPYFKYVYKNKFHWRKAYIFAHLQHSFNCILLEIIYSEHANTSITFHFFFRMSYRNKSKTSEISCFSWKIQFWDKIVYQMNLITFFFEDKLLI